MFPDGADHPAGQAQPARNAREGHSDASDGPTPTATSPASEHVPPSSFRQIAPGDMTPLPVRSVPETDRWYLWLTTSMHPNRDTDNPHVTKG